jgi:pSer/pThr/pTyr-binding forkhead associated (FHA) protein
MQALVLLILKIVFLAVLWLFVLSAVLAIRRDLSGRPVTAGAAAGSGGGSLPRGREATRSNARQLVVTDGALAGTTIALGDRPITIGRAADSTLALSDDYVSTRHARLIPHDGAWLVEDMGSTNGTYLDREQVAAPTPVPLGVPIRVGKTVLELRR